MPPSPALAPVEQLHLLEQALPEALGFQQHLADAG
ncbi:MAG: hypothetical protein RLZZ11_1434, partial [Cyanobacteriota bacterium]